MAPPISTGIAGIQIFRIGSGLSTIPRFNIGTIAITNSNIMVNTTSLSTFTNIGGMAHMVRHTGTGTHTDTGATGNLTGVSIDMDTGEVDGATE